MGDKVDYVHLSPGAPLPRPHARPHKAAVVAEVPCAREWRNGAARWLVDSGCIYAMCVGIDGAAWETAIDVAHCEKFDWKPSPDKNFAMTTCHDSLEDALRFTKFVAFHPEVGDLEPVIVHIAAAPAELRLCSSYDNTPAV